MSSISSALSSLLGGSSSTGIDLSSLLEAAYGASSSGLDVSSAVSAAVTAARAPEQAWQTQESTLLSQISALSQIQTYANNLDNDMQSLNNLTGPLSARTVTSSNSSVVSASSASGATPGNHVVVVNSLAATDAWTSGTFASASTAVPSGSFTLTTGSGTTTITTDGTKTLSQIASEINGDKLGLTASVVTDSTGSRLALVANTSGSAANFTVGNGTGISFNQSVTGANASLTVDGISISSATNTVTNAIPGMTLSLLSASPGTEVSLQVNPDTSQATTAINQFVSDYNTLVNSLAAQFTFTGSSEGVLATDSAVRNLQSTILSSLSYSAGGSISNLSSLGINVNNDGTLTVQSATLQSALSNNFSGVQNFFQGNALNGFANKLDQQLTSFTDSASGSFTLDLKSMNSQVTDLKTDVTNFETNYITPLQAQLQAEYSQAEIELQQLPIQMKQISSELGTGSSS